MTAAHCVAARPRPAPRGGLPPQTYPSGGLPDSCCRGAAQWASWEKAALLGTFVETEAGRTCKKPTAHCVGVDLGDTSNETNQTRRGFSLLRKQGSFFWSHFFAIKGVIFVEDIYKRECAYMNMYVPEIALLFLFIFTVVVYSSSRWSRVNTKHSRLFLTPSNGLFLICCNWLI